MPDKIMLDQSDDDALGGPRFEFGIVADLCEIQATLVEQDTGYILVSTRSGISRLLLAVQSLYSRPRDLQRRRARYAPPISLLPCPPWLTCG